MWPTPGRMEGKQHTWIWRSTTAARALIASASWRAGARASSTAAVGATAPNMPPCSEAACVKRAAALWDLGRYTAGSAKGVAARSL